MSDLISIAEARKRVLESVTPLGDEAVALDAALGRVLAEDVSSPIEVPPFDSSAMDGFAVIAGAEAELQVVGEARAGRPADVRVRAGQAVRISTGAVVPEGADAVVPVERTTAVKGGDSAVSADFVAVSPPLRGKAQPSRDSAPLTAVVIPAEAVGPLRPASPGALRG